MAEEYSFAEQIEAGMSVHPRLSIFDAANVTFDGAGAAVQGESVAIGIMVGVRARANPSSCDKSSALTSDIQELPLLDRALKRAQSDRPLSRRPISTPPNGRRLAAA
ncbi:hypothetical protein [Nocardia farcinica]|uniref:hypothetical protein n=1 Tax=Nocardia farcinica TaxID=37329 RepID=UPI00189434CC|nr:hypothetical protein [Nocardia farcinica]MBF6271718.1 hypothetical protein [Nocardia farcinica]MCZ9330372.1 hypothetical protein [Nocardia farcinica]